jgi:hypothetical protein
MSVCPSVHVEHFDSLWMEFCEESPSIKRVFQIEQKCHTVYLKGEVRCMLFTATYVAQCNRKLTIAFPWKYFWYSSLIMLQNLSKLMARLVRALRRAKIRTRQCYTYVCTFPFLIKTRSIKQQKRMV